MSGAGDAAGRDRERGGGEEEELESSEDGAAMPEEEGGTAATAHARDAHVAAITFVGALKIPVNISN